MSARPFSLARFIHISDGVPRRLSTRRELERLKGQCGTTSVCRILLLDRFRRVFFSSSLARELCFINILAFVSILPISPRLSCSHSVKRCTGPASPTKPRRVKRLIRLLAYSHYCWRFVFFSRRPSRMRASPLVPPNPRAHHEDEELRWWTSLTGKRLTSRFIKGDLECRGSSKFKKIIWRAKKNELTHQLTSYALQYILTMELI